MTEPVEVRHVTPTGRSLTRVSTDGTSCAKCGRGFRVGDRVAVEIPCVPAWQT